MHMPERIVIALGGNALQSKDSAPTAEAQLEVVKRTSEFIAQPAMPGSVLYDEGYDCNCGDLLCAAHPDTDWRVCLEHAEKLGLGTRSYQLIKI